jgi:hypothetical protein
VIRRRDGKKHPVWRFKYRDHSGKWRYGTGWPDRKKTLEHALALEAECRAIRKGEKEAPGSWLRERNRPIGDVIAAYLEWGKVQGGRRGHGWADHHYAWRKRALIFWTGKLGLATLSDIDIGRVEAEPRALLNGRSGKTVNGYMEAIKALCSWSVKRGYLKGNPLISSDN